jgi:hypothetical protein
LTFGQNLRSHIVSPLEVGLFEDRLEDGLRLHQRFDRLELFRRR